MQTLANNETKQVTGGTLTAPEHLIPINVRDLPNIVREDNIGFLNPPKQPIQTWMMSN